jgi:hypothetical protein
MNRDEDRGFWTVVIALAIAVVAALHAYTGTLGEGPPVAQATASPAPHRGVEDNGGTAAPATPASVSSPRITTVYECVQRGERVFSDRRCGNNAQEHAIEEPNHMAPPDPSVVALSMSDPEPNPTPAALASAAPAAPQRPRSQCRAIEDAKERIDARMREGYGSAEGERLRERLRQLNTEYYELRCRRFRP